MKYWLKFSTYARRWYVCEYWGATDHCSPECREVIYYEFYADALEDLRNRVRPT